METQKIQNETPNLRVRNRIAGGVMALLGVYVIVESLGYKLGSIFRMGPGFLPLGLGFLIVLFGALIAIINDDGDEAADEIAWRPVILVPSSMLAFGLLIEPIGLLVATAALVFISGAADRNHTWRSLTALFVVLVTLVYVVFTVLLSTPFKLITGVI